MNKLPADPLALVLGILALVIGVVGCCCYGITAIIPLAMAIIGLVVANKSLREFGENPEAYNPQSRSNVNTAKVLNIIAIVLNSFIFLIAVGVLVFYGTLMSTAFLKGLEHSTFEDDFYFDSEMESDTIDTWSEDDYIMDEDNLEVEEVEGFDEELIEGFDLE